MSDNPSWEWWMRLTNGQRVELVNVKYPDFPRGAGRQGLHDYVQKIWSEEVGPPVDNSYDEAILAQEIYEGLVGS